MNDTYENPNADLLPDYPPEPATWSVVAATGGGVRTFHVRTAAEWVDLDGVRREWAEVCDLDENRRPQLRAVPSSPADRATVARDVLGELAARLADGRLEYGAGNASHVIRDWMNENYPAQDPRNHE